MKKAISVLVLVVCLSLLVALATSANKLPRYDAIQLPYQFVIFGAPNSCFDKHDTIIGGMETTGRAVYWHKGQVTEIGVTGWEYTGGIAFNDRGSIILWARNSSSLPSKYLFARKDGSVQEIVFPEESGHGGYPYAINNDDQIAGGMRLDSNGRTAGFIWKNGKFTDIVTQEGWPWCGLHDINKHHQAVGSITKPTIGQAIMYDEGQINHLITPVGQGSLAFAINDSSEVVGEIIIDRLFTTAALWRDGKLIVLPSLGGIQSHAADINNRGEILGSAQNNKGVWRECVWINGEPIDIEDRLTSPIQIAYCFAINDRGQILCRARSGQGLGGRYILDPIYRSR